MRRSTMVLGATAIAVLLLVVLTQSPNTTRGGRPGNVRRWNVRLDSNAYIAIHHSGGIVRLVAEERDPE